MKQKSTADSFNLKVTSLSQYVRLENCERYLRFQLHPEEEKALLKKWDLRIQPLTPLLKESGAEFEADVASQIARQGEKVIDLQESDVQATIQWLQKARQPVVLLQPSLEGQLGNYQCRGRADVIRLHRTRGGDFRVLIADIKASRHERMEHRLQVAVYAHLLQSLASKAGVTIADLRGTVLHIQEDGSIPALDENTPAFELEPYTTVLNHLVVGPDSIVNRIAQQPFEDVPYHLSYKCDGCFYNALCMYDTAERFDLSLVPYVSAVEKRVLRNVGVKTLPALAGLMELPKDKTDGREMKVARGKQPLVAELSNQWPVGPNLPVLVQRARQALHRFDPTVEAGSFIYGSGFGTLPSDDEHPTLVKIFFDAQHDYLQDRVYLISALVKGPNGEQVVVTCTEAPPTERIERKLLVDWVSGVLRAVRKVSAGDAASMHLYCYNRYDQKVLLEALKRHLDHVAALPAFFDLMTQSPALTQPIISFLSEELQERANLGLVCTPLHDAARFRGFDWKDDEREYFRLFRAKLFDNRRDVARQQDGTITRATENVAKDDPRRVTIEAASRFNSQIPLEYAYGAWKRLPKDLEDDRLLGPYRLVSLDDVIAFAEHRARALAHIEGSFRVKARFIDKPALDLRGLAQSALAEPPLAQSIQEFLYMEHHAALQTKLLMYSLPIERRAQTGLAMLLRFKRHDPSGNTHRFDIPFDVLGLDPVLTMNAFRLKEGAWVVINSVDPAPSAGTIKNGRLATIKALGADWIDLSLLDATFYRSKFRYPHNNILTPQRGQLYTLDEMADDLNADKALEALGNANTNVLYQWLRKQPANRTVRTATRSAAAQFHKQVEVLEGRRKPTSRQSEVIADRLAEPLFLVQGPPGTGKSHTVAWAVLARMAAAAAEGRPLRVAVSCKTHNAIHVVLRTLIDKWKQVTAVPTPISRPLSGMRIYKIVWDDGADYPKGSEPLNPYHCKASQIESLLQESLLVVGSTPGGLFNLARYRGPGKKIDWNVKPFDLVVLDEASQMSLPEGILACAFLKPEGQAIVVGDHRQMPPIIAHTWEEEEKRSATSGHPYLSLFESLIERGFPRVALDESFRLHSIIAEFLQANIYVQDGIHFFSRRKELLTQPPASNGYVSRALDPNYPIVVIEHTEQGSQQYNTIEAEIIAPLINVCANKLRLDGLDGIGVVVPHRAQKALLREQFPDLAASNSIDTVERFQGGERDVIIVSATASDPDYVLAEADFLLNLNRLNVALSRPRKKLIVVASRSVISLLTSDLDVFQNAVIWKRLYHQWAAEELWQGRLNGVSIALRGKRAQ